LARWSADRSCDTLLCHVLLYSRGDSAPCSCSPPYPLFLGALYGKGAEPTRRGGVRLRRPCNKDISARVAINQRTVEKHTARRS
jgi:hypothetical protein